MHLLRMFEIGLLRKVRLIFLLRLLFLEGALEERGCTCKYQRRHLVVLRSTHFATRFPVLTLIFRRSTLVLHVVGAKGLVEAVPVVLEAVPVVLKRKG